ncbi:ATP-binding protein [Rhizobium leguminosarum]|uniref:ATP-binding protein n=1 Tax=Rhizobium leguminosarum TaxID=384 RepID=UPI001FEDFEBE|nr:ATP-binding protein [Rhizobium leguminosarum]
MDFQAQVGTWFAAHLLARLPVGGRFGMANTALPTELRLETGEGLDDILVRHDDGGRIDIQCKTSAGLSQSATSPLAKTIAQLVKSVTDMRASGVTIDTSKARAVLAIAADAPRSLDTIERGCRAFDMGGQWATTKAQRNKAERDALDLFEMHARSAWLTHASSQPSDDDLITIARMFKVARFSMDEGAENWREASAVVGARLYGSPANGDAPLRDLKAIVRGLISSGAPADRAGLIGALRSRGHNDVGAPNYEADLACVEATTTAELDRLAGHTRLPMGPGIPIRRHSDGPLAAAVSSGSLIVIGEPGAGKTGALVAMAQAERDAGATVVFLSVDRFPGIGTTADLQAELQLERSLSEVLCAAPGSAPKLLIIDALDAARGGPAEGVFAQLIETMATPQNAGWTVVASIRTFDLKNGRRFRNAMSGCPPNADFAEASLSNVRHFQVPRLTDADLDLAGCAEAQLGGLLTAAPQKLRDLLHNVFNLSLAAQLLSDGADPDSIRGVSTQSDLIDAYEDHRLVGNPMRQAAAATIEQMVRRRRLAVRKVSVQHDRVDEVVQSGVLSEAGDLVSFSHHVVFDHVAGRFFLEWDETDLLIGQLGGDSSIALMLAPALRFAVERLWRGDQPGKLAVWRLVADIYSTNEVDPVLANVALRTAIEGVHSQADIVGLTELISSRSAQPAMATMLSRLARFVGLSVDAAGSISREEALAWAQVAEASILSGMRELSDATRFLLHMLFERGDLSDPSMATVFGRASRALLTFAWAADPSMQQTATGAIRFVGKSFGSDPAASRLLLDRILRDPHFSSHADREATWLAEQIMPIARSDRDFAVEIARVLYSRDIDDNSTSHFGGRPSRIMALSSNRKQDYRHSRYHLGRHVPQLLELSPYLGTRVVIESALEEIDRDMPIGEQREQVSIPSRPTFDLLGRDYALNAWDQPGGRGNSDQNALVQFVAFLRSCSVAAFEESTGAAASGYTSPAVWTRLLGIGAERVAEMADLLWPYASNPTVIAHEDTVRDAARFIAAAYPLRSLEERAAFETDALRQDLFEDEREQRWWRHALSRFLSQVDADMVATDSMRSLRTELAEAGELTGNTPLRSFSIRSGSNRSVTRSLMAGRGVNVDQGIDARMIAQSETLHDLVGQTPSTSEAPALAALWDATQATIAMYDEHAGDLNAEVEQPVWGNISNAVERIASSEAYVPSSNVMPPIATFLALVRRLWLNRFPEPRDSDGSGLSWGNWEVRIYAAQAYVALAHKFGADHGEILDMIEASLADPVPQVRLQAARSLQVLSRVAPERMWPVAEAIARNETHSNILASFLTHFLFQFTWHEVERCEAIIGMVLERHDTLADVEEAVKDEVGSSLGQLAAQLWVQQEREAALGWLEDWTRGLPGHREELWSFISMLRHSLFARYSYTEEQEVALCDRSQRAAMIILEACSAASIRTYTAVMVDNVQGANRDAAIETYRAAEDLIQHLMNQLYFGSGAYHESHDPAPGLPTREAMRQFLAGYRPMLNLLANSHEPSTHHHLVELYEYLIPADPEGVFAALHHLLTGPAAGEDYHHEDLASGVIVRMITRYIADHRSIFEDNERRAALVEILRLFSEVGWSEALRLLYDLPDLLR